MLEYAVRPFQTPNAQGRIIIPSTPQGVIERAILKWGAQSTLPPPVYAGINVKCCQQKTNELSREGETVRINGSDGESYIDVFRANKLKLNRKTSGSCSGVDDPFGLGVDVMSQEIEATFDDFNAQVTEGLPDDCDDEMTLNNNTA
jgi:hypothetical protein